MALKARLKGDADEYRIRGAIWELGSFAYRACLHLVPTVARSNLSRRVLSADGMTLQEVIGAAKTRASSAIGNPVRRLELIPNSGSKHEPSGVLRQRPVPRRYPPPTD
jgi:hypothetical protein